MSRLVTFGCSHTYGYGLPDVTPSNTSDSYNGHSKFAWPAWLSKDLSLELVNAAFPGWSNARILQEILAFEYHPDDLVVILWASVDRDRLFMEDGSEFNVGSWNDDATTKQYYSLHSDLDMAIKTLTCIHHSDMFFKCKNITAKHFLYTSKFNSILATAKALCVWYDTPVDHTRLHDIAVDRASDKFHYGIKTHRNISDYIKGKL
jgi:hypothetical protein